MDRLFRKRHYWLSVLSAVVPSFPFDQSPKWVEEILSEVVSLAQCDSTNIPNMNFRRVYIPKKSDTARKGDARPLGVPSVA